MCLAIPMKVIEKEGSLGKVHQGGVTYDVDFTLLPEAETGDYVLVHAGFVIQRLNETEAEKTLRLFEEMFRKEAEAND